MIQIENVSKSIGTTEILKNVSVTVPSSSIYGIIGESGAGKSTLLKCINRLADFDSGTIYVDGNDTKNLNDEDLRKLRINMGMVFQNFVLMEQKNVFKNIALPLECWNYPKNKIEEKVLELVELVGIKEHLHKHPRELSGGQKQRVALARALSSEPKYLLCDECTSALDPKNARMIMDLLTKIRDELDVTILVVTHDMALARTYCEQLTLMEQGKVIDQGPTQEVFGRNMDFFMSDFEAGVINV